MEKAVKASVKTSYPYGMLMTRNIFRVNDLANLQSAISFNLWTEINTKTLYLMKVQLETFDDVVVVEENQQEGPIET